MTSQDRQTNKQTEKGGRKGGWEMVVILTNSLTVAQYILPHTTKVTIGMTLCIIGHTSGRQSI